MAGLTSFSVTLGALFESAEELKRDYPKTPKADRKSTRLNSSHRCSKTGRCFDEVRFQFPGNFCQLNYFIFSR